MLATPTDHAAIALSVARAGADACISYLSIYGDTEPAGEPRVFITRFSYEAPLIEAFARLDIGSDADGHWAITAQDVLPHRQVRSFDAKGFACKAMADELSRHGFFSEIQNEPDP